jgi:hypothetical protein
MLSLSSLILAGVLGVNSVAILSEERFLARSKSSDLNYSLIQGLLD